MQYRSLPASFRSRAGVLAALLLLPLLALQAHGRLEAAEAPLPPVKPVPAPVQLGNLLRAQDVQAASLIRVGEAREAYNVDGTGLTAAVIDTGIRASHRDFAGKVAAQVNYTTDNNGVDTNAADGDGHGTHVSGIIAARGTHTGMAPGARIVALKALDNSGSGDFQAIRDALDWVIENREAYRISVVNLSLGDGGNYSSRTADSILSRIRTLRAAGVPVCAAAGNDFYGFDSVQGMGYPAIFSDTISVGAVFDAAVGQVTYGDGARAHTSAPDRICPFSQRLHESVSRANRMDILAPGAPITSAGITGDSSSATSHGTSQATPVVAGVILLMQEFYLRQKGVLPPVDRVEQWLRAGAVANLDGDNEDDNVANTGVAYPRIDAVGAMQAMETDTGAGYSVSGTVSLGGAGLDSVSISAGGKVVSTDDSGRYTLAGLDPGTYAVAASRPGYAFTPSSRTVTVGPNATGVDFTATQTAFTLSGTVTAGGAGLAGVTVKAGGATVATDAEGRYRFADLGSGTYTVTPTRNGYTFEPASRSVEVDADRAGVNFAGTLTTYTVRGRITQDGTGVSGVSVTAGSATTITGISGSYVLSGLLPGSHGITPSRPGFTFAPAARTVSVTEDMTGIDFAATRTGYTLKGTVRIGTAGLAGVTVLAGGRSASTDSEGRYALENVPAGDQTVTVSRTGYLFTPASLPVSVSADVTGLDFTAAVQTFQVTGRVTLAGEGLAGVTIAAGEFSTTTGQDGEYTLAGLPGGAHLLHAGLAGFAFTPATRSLTVGPSRSDVNFTAQRLYQIRGVAREGSTGLAGVKVSTGSQSTTTNAQGEFVLSDLKPGTHTLRAFREGYDFTPAVKSVTLKAADAEGILFTGTPVPNLDELIPQKSSVAARRVLLVTAVFTGKVSKPTPVTLSSSSSAAIVPKRVTVPRNRDRVVFRVIARRVTSVERVTLTATSGGVKRQVTVSIQPQLGR